MIQQSTLFHQPTLPRFGGETFSEELDRQRLTGQMSRVYEIMRDGKWRTLAQIQVHSGSGTYGVLDSEAGISARLRDLRKKPFGGHTVNRRRVGNGGQFEYQLEVR